MFAHNGPCGTWLTGRILKATHQGAELRVNCDVYDCLFSVVYCAKSQCIASDIHSFWSHQSLYVLWKADQLWPFFFGHYFVEHIYGVK